MAKRDAEILRQERELHKLRVSSKNLVIREKDISSLLFLYIFSQSVLQQANTIMSTGEDHLLTTIQEDYSMAGAVASSANKKQGVSGKSVDPGQSVKLPKVLEKDFRSRQLIREALQENDFLKNLGPGQVREVVDYMELKRVPAGTYVIREGDSGEGNIQEKCHITYPFQKLNFFLFFRLSPLRVRRGGVRGYQGRQGPGSPRRREGLRRVGHPLQLHEDSLHQR